jgi:Helicase conserved C-terminal domain
MRRRHEQEPLTLREMFTQLAVDELKPLVALVRGHRVQARKAELVEMLMRVMEDPAQLRSLYEGLDDLAQKAVREATHADDGALNRRRFYAKYSADLDFGKPNRIWGKAEPSRLCLFFPDTRRLPTDLQAALESFVTELPPLSAQALDELPTLVRRPHVVLGEYHREPNAEEVTPRIRQTARAGLLNLMAVLRLVDAGEVRVSDKTHRPSAATVKAVAAVLADGDFYTDADLAGDPWQKLDLAMQPFAWPLLVQAGGLAHLAGTKLQLSPAGRKVLAQPAHEAIRTLWNKWQKTTLLDEFSRVDVIKGQQSKNALTAVAPRRDAIIATLAECPASPWIAVDELFRLLKASEEPFEVARDAWRLYLCEQQYGSFGYDARYTWESLQGRYALAFLFEYAATLGIVDVAYVEPQGARNDYRDRWGTDDLSCLSRYDGLLYVRINPLSAWCLGQAERYVPEAFVAEPVLKVLPNRDVVAGERPLSAGDVLLLDRNAERTSEAVWRLDAPRILQAVEQGLSVRELLDFLTARSAEPLQQTVSVFLDDLAAKAGQLEDLGTARLIQCADAQVADLLAHDRRLRALVQRAGERQLVFGAADEVAVKQALRELGYVLPPR